MSDDDLLLSAREAASRAGVSYGAWKVYVHRGTAPPPDDPDEDEPNKYRRKPRWRGSTVDAFRAIPRHPGRRTDVERAREERRRQDATALAEPAAAPPPDLTAWLRANHPVLLRVAEALVDARDELVAAAPHPELMAEAIDTAGERIDRRPSKALASAVAYAIGLAQRVQVDPDTDIAITLHRHGHLRDEFAPYAGSHA